MSTRIPPAVARHLGYYLYLYVDPRNNRVFYVGKGQGERILAHMSEKGESRKVAVIAELGREGLRPRLEVLAHALADEETALRIEAAVIDVLRLDELTNLCRGWRSVQLGRLSLEDLIAYYDAPPAEFDDRVLLVRINRLYRHNMPALELYEATRGVWKLSKRREGATYALAVFEGVVRESYKIDAWHPAGSTSYATRAQDELKRDGRWEFTGVTAPPAVRDKFNGDSVMAFFIKGQRSPIAYVNC